MEIGARPNDSGEKFESISTISNNLNETYHSLFANKVEIEDFRGKKFGNKNNLRRLIKQKGFEPTIDFLHTINALGSPSGASFPSTRLEPYYLGLKKAIKAETPKNSHVRYNHLSQLDQAYFETSDGKLEDNGE